MTDDKYVYMHYCGRDDCNCFYLSKNKETPEGVKCAGSGKIIHIAHRFDGRTVRYLKDKEV